MFAHVDDEKFVSRLQIFCSPLIRDRIMTFFNLFVKNENNYYWKVCRKNEDVFSFQIRVTIYMVFRLSGKMEGIGKELKLWKKMFLQKLFNIEELCGIDGVYFCMEHLSFSMRWALRN